MCGNLYTQLNVILNIQIMDTSLKTIDLSAVVYVALMVTVFYLAL